jgi:hypothetical protein
MLYTNIIYWQYNNNVGSYEIFPRFLLLSRGRLIHNHMVLINRRLPTREMERASVGGTSVPSTVVGSLRAVDSLHTARPGGHISSHVFNHVKLLTQWTMLTQLIN